MWKCVLFTQLQQFPKRRKSLWSKRLNHYKKHKGKTWNLVIDPYLEQKNLWIYSLRKRKGGRRKVGRRKKGPNGMFPEGRGYPGQKHPLHTWRPWILLLSSAQRPCHTGPILPTPQRLLLPKGSVYPGSRASGPKEHCGLRY